VKSISAKIALISLFACPGSIVAAQTISNETPISFGQLIVGGTGSVTIPSDADTRITTGSVALVGFAAVQRGYADITYTPGAQIAITIPGSITMTGANSPTILPSLDGLGVKTMPVSGVLRIYFGGTIDFPTFGAYGLISVSIPVTIDPF
jgi:Domain of unknown function (DUF4402)